MRDHDRIEELMAVHALGGLDPEDEDALRREMAEHGDACPECRRLESEFGEVAGRLAFALDPVPVSEGLEDRLVAAATAQPVPLRARAGVARRSGPSERAGRRLRPLVATAAAVVIFAAGLVAGVVASGGGDAVPSGSRVVAFLGEGDGSLSVAYRRGHDGVYLLGSGLREPPAGRVYEVWMFQDGTPIPATCFRPSGDGSVFAFVDAGLGSTDSMAVTLEPASCPSAPTTSPILTAQIA